MVFIAVQQARTKNLFSEEGVRCFYFVATELISDLSGLLSKNDWTTNKEPANTFDSTHQAHALSLEQKLVEPQCVVDVAGAAADGCLELSEDM